jgi:CBS domain-containing membrane protein
VASPLLAGAGWRDRAIGAIGGLIGIGLAATLSTGLAGDPVTGVLLAAPIGASAVLVFAVPASPLAQPWPVIGGCIVAALTGLVVAHLLGHGPLAAGVAVGTAIAAMSALRCLHPPGGACALLPVLGGPAVLAKAAAFAFVPVGLNAVLLVLVGLAFHRLSGHSYPHRPVPLPQQPRLLGEDIDAALAEAQESFDISREDLEALLARAEAHAEARRR